VIGGDRHGIAGLVFPSGQGQVSFALHLSVSVYQALYRSRPVYEGEFDEELARDLVGLSQMLGTLFGAAGFLYTTEPDVLTPVPTGELVALMTGQLETLTETATVMLAGMRESLVPVRAVENAWKKENLSRSTSGFILLNLFLPYEAAD